ncbi:aromatic-ring-hydroxylating dioxygenase subunit beta [Pseudonocardia bannensis]|uniref:Aromatic-ring-hydroxylating dioxygenase subunit beta n=1 Tax=Pseudonocardia bannensis TaxID=630973 RepID=A0A848DDT5_9PSEU|nr:aromatic-ring-hydroxylating dioxygenase subunit beta [Pseudonocardia bannensis]NMH90735.1 aromatic-ring-hydroxylating dioxygenase subunit beta [Pseudonocardia bannensis]
MSGDVFRLIAQAQAAYARCIDSDRLEEWPDFFTEKCFYTVTTADNHREGLEAGLIWADTRGMLTDRVSALREANIYERHSYRHILGQPFILDSDGEDGEGVRCETPFLVVRIMRDGTTDLFASGRYLDRYLVDGDAVLLAERVVVCDSSRIDTLLALPL